MATILSQSGGKGWAVQRNAVFSGGTRSTAKIDYLKTVDIEYTVTWNQRPTRMVESELEDPFLATFVVFIICAKLVAR